MNYAALAKKYVPGAKFKLTDRSYDGLEWIGPGEKPTKENFMGWLTEESRLGRVEEVRELAQMSLIEEQRKRNIAKIAEESKSVEEKLKDEYQQMRNEILAQFHEAKDIEQRLKAREALYEVWREIEKSHELINQEALKYLCDTDFFVTRAQETGQEIPRDVLENRIKARSNINQGTLIYPHWRRIREIHMPSRKELEEAIIKGGEELARLKDICNSIALRYPKYKIKEQK